MSGAEAITKYWSQGIALLGLGFFSGGLVQTVTSGPGIAVDRAAIASIQEDMKTLVLSEKDHDRDITNLLIITTQQSDQIKLLTEQLNKGKK